MDVLCMDLYDESTQVKTAIRFLTDSPRGTGRSRLSAGEPFPERIVHQVPGAVRRRGRRGDSPGGAHGPALGINLETAENFIETAHYICRWNSSIAVFVELCKAVIFVLSHLMEWKQVYGKNTLFIQ